MSIIIVGIGNEDFTNMNILDADQNPLISSWGEQMCRDIVQFVPFRDFHNDAFKLREEILHEIPEQVVSFYSNNKINPIINADINMDNFKFD